MDFQRILFALLNRLQEIALGLPVAMLPDGTEPGDVMLGKRGAAVLFSLPEDFFNALRAGESTIVSQLRIDLPFRDGTLGPCAAEILEAIRVKLGEKQLFLSDIGAVAAPDKAKARLEFSFMDMLPLGRRPSVDKSAGVDFHACHFHVTLTLNKEAVA